MIKILFICHGNICRSPMAEFMMKYLVRKQGLEADYEIASAATSSEGIGNGMYGPAKRCLDAHNVPYTARAARRIEKKDLEYYDFIIAMEEYNLVNLKRTVGDSEKYSLLLDYTDSPGDIADPWYSGDFETSFKQIAKGCEGLLQRTRGLRHNI